MKVLKFGGTSVGTTESLLNVKQIVENIEEPAVIVVSALGGLTDKLISTARKAAGRDDSYKDDVQAIKERHRGIIKDVVPDAKRNDCSIEVESLLEELKSLFDGLNLIGDLPEKTLDAIVSYGERISSVIVSSMIEDARHLNSLEIIKTEKWFGNNIAENKLTTDNIVKKFSPKEKRPIIVGGFISTDKDTGEITNLGRGGSDFTAALVAAALDAEVLEIWTDVDGFMTSDPRIVQEARIIPEMSFVESMELCTYGAKVIYPPTIYPVFHKNIPIKILNTFNPQAPGTLIKDYTRKESGDWNPVRGISALRGMGLISIKGEAVRNLALINTRTFNALAKRGIGVRLVSHNEESRVFSFAIISSEIDHALRLLEEEFAPEIIRREIDSIVADKNLAIIAIVGDNIRTLGRILPRITNTLQRSSIDVKAESEGASSTTVNIAVEEKDTEEALCLIHSLFF